MGIFCFVLLSLVKDQKERHELWKIKITCNDARDWLVIFDVKRHLYTMNYLKYG